MEPRINRHKSTSIVKPAILAMLFIILCMLGLVLMNNDMSVYHNSDAQTALDKVGDKNVTINWEEKYFQLAMHQMTHQKVQARSKVGAVQVTDENIQALIVIAKQSKYKHKDYYLDILDYWSEGDFSSIDTEHNELRNLQGEIEEDTKARGIVSKKQEQKFINTVFKEN